MKNRYANWIIARVQNAICAYLTSSSNKVPRDISVLRSNCTSDIRPTVSEVEPICSRLPETATETECELQQSDDCSDDAQNDTSSTHLLRPSSQPVASTLRSRQTVSSSASGSHATLFHPQAKNMDAPKDETHCVASSQLMKPPMCECFSLNLWYFVLLFFLGFICWFSVYDF